MNESKLNAALTAYACSPTAASRAAIVEAVGAAQAQQSVPTGWKLVPIEPTPKMVDSTFGDRLIGYSHNARNKTIYAAMLAASPTPPAAAPGQDADLTLFDIDLMAKKFPLPETRYNGCGDGSEPLYTPEMVYAYAHQHIVAMAHARKPELDKALAHIAKLEATAPAADMSAPTDEQITKAELEAQERDHASMMRARMIAHNAARAAAPVSGPSESIGDDPKFIALLDWLLDAHKFGKEADIPRVNAALEELIAYTNIRQTNVLWNSLQNQGHLIPRHLRQLVKRSTLDSRPRSENSSAPAPIQSDEFAELRASLKRIADGDVMSAASAGYSHRDTVIAYQSIARNALATTTSPKADNE